MEVVLQRAQTIDFAYREQVREPEQMSGKGSRLTYEELAVFFGVTRSDVIALSPKRFDYVREEEERFSELAKNLRKARAERDSLRKGASLGSQNDRQKYKKDGDEDDP